MNAFRHQSPLNILLSLLMAFIVWLALAPTQLGGQVTYVIVDGNSMEPKFHFGDLVLLRKQPVYRVGDAVTYQNAEMGRFVFHRIVEIQLDRFVLQGDHNTWLDTYHPSQDEIIGKLWIRVPAAGKIIQWARQPLHLALGCGLLGGIMTASMILNPSHGGKRKQKQSGNSGGLLEGGLYATGFVTLALLGLTILAFTRPLTSPADNIQYQQDSYFLYSAAGTPGVYDTNAIRPGEPIFPKLTCFLNVGLVYNLTGGLQAITGSHQLNVRVMDEKSGWQRTIPLVAETPFSGNSYTSGADLDLCQIEEMVSSVEAQTGLHPSTYLLEVVAHTAITGSFDGRPVFDSFDSTMSLKFDKVHFYLASDSTQDDPLHTTKQGLVSGLSEKPNTWLILGWEPTVQTVRALALSGLAASLSGLLAISWYFFTLTQSSQENKIRLKYRGLLMDVYGPGVQQDLPIVDVASMDDLARLAERQSTMIAHTVLNFLHYYMVQSNGVIYRYIISTRQGGTVAANQTLPRLSPPTSARNDYFDADPVDDGHYRYRVDLNRKGRTQPESTQSVFIPRIRL